MFQTFLKRAQMENGWSPVANDLLKAETAPGMPARTRILAWLILNSWGLQHKCEFAMWQHHTAKQQHVADDLGMSKQQCSNIMVELEETGWIRTNAGRIYVNGKPKIKAQRDELDPAEDYELFAAKARESWVSKTHPTVVELGNHARKLWNRYRQLNTEAAQKFDALDAAERQRLIEEERRRETPAAAAEGAPEKYTDPCTPTSVQCTENDCTDDRILICKEHKKDSPVGELYSELEAAAELKLRKALTHHFGFSLSANDRIQATFLTLARAQNLSVDDLIDWIAEKASSKRQQRYKVRSVGALATFAAQDLATWAQQTAELRAKLAAGPAPELELDLYEVARTYIDLAKWSEHPQHAEFVRDLEAFEQQHPEIIAEIRAGSAAATAGGAL